MTKARDLANLIAAGNPLADGAISVAEISDLTASAAEINQLDGVTSNLQDQLDNITVTAGTLTKSFTSGETASIALSAALSPAPVVSVTKEVPQTGQSSKGAWDVNATASNYDLHNTATATTLTPSSTFNTPFNSGGSAATSLTNSVSYTSYFTSPNVYAIAISNDGAKFYAAEPSGGIIRQFNLTTAYDITTLSVNGTYTSSEEGGIKGIHFKPDGTKMYIIGFDNDTVYEYNLTTAFDITTASYSNNSFAVTGQVSNASSVRLSSDGTIMYALGGYNQGLYQYTLSTAWDVSTASYASKSLNVQSQETDIVEVVFSSDGTKLFAMGLVNDRIYNWNLSTPWDISTGSFSTYYSVQSDDNQTWGLAISSDDTIAYVLGQQNDKFYQYSIGSSALTLGTGSFASTDVGKRIQGNGGDVILTSTAGAYSTTGGSAFTDSSAIASGSWSMRGLKSAGDDDGIGMPSVSNAYDVPNATATGNTFSVVAQSASLLHMTFSPDGTKFYVIDYTNGYMMQYGCTTAFDLTTASYSSKTFYSYQQDGQPVAARFNPAGTSMFIAGRNNDRVYQYSLSTAYDISTASYSTSWAPSAGKVNAGFADILFNNDGSFIYTLDYNTDVIGQFACPTEYQLSGVSSDSTYEYSLPTNSIATPQGMSFNSDGTKMYIISTNNKIDIYNLSTAYRVSTMSYSSTIDINGGNMALHFSTDGTKMFVASRESDNLIEYSVGEIFTPTSQYHIGITNSGGQINTDFWVDINSMTADQTAGDGTVHYAVSTDDRTTWSVAKASDGVRPIVRDNSGTWQYNSDNVSSSTLDITGATYSGDANTFATNGQDTQSYTVAVKPDGTKIYVASYNSDSVYQYDLSTAFDLSTASYNNVNFSFSSQMSTPRNIQFKPDGTEMYLLDLSNFTIYQYTMSTPWDLTTASYSYSFSTNNTTTTPRGLAFKSDGTKMYITDGSTTNQYVYKYDLSTAWRVDTASYSASDGALNITAQFTNSANSVMFNSTGTKMHVYDYGTRNLYEYDLSTAWDISTGSYNNVYVSLDPQPSAAGYGQPTTVHLDYTVGKLYAMRSERLFEWTGLTTSSLPYSTNATWADATTNDEFYALQQALSLANNRMDKTQLDAVADGSHFTLGDTLDLMIALRQNTASASTPTSDGVSINYDAEALNQGAVLGTDYDYDFPSSTSVRITSNAAQNLKIRVV